ncbi:MAG: V-type ATP synthase subunit C [Methanoregulaceae archaeon]|nr:V-type ATP synthase subunit C [Methanoregulaceae archaeon]
MAEVVKGPAPYVYVCTRMRIRMSKLLPREDYIRLLNMGIPEITRFIEETEYKREIDELSPSFQGIDLIELGLSWNMAKEYQNIQKITPGILKQFTQAYLHRWDIQNILTILRGKMQGVKPGRIKEILIPAGEFDRAFLDRLIAEDSPERIIASLKGWRMFKILEKEYPKANEEGSFSRMENELYKQFYADLLLNAGSGLKGSKSFREYILLDIDITNIRNMFRLRADQLEEDAEDMAIPGATFPVKEFQRLIGIENNDEFIDALKARIRIRTLLEMLEELRGKRSTREIEIALIRIQLAQMEKMAKLHPFSIHPILAYLERKKYEVFNLRAIARGKESNLPADRIRGYLVI